MDAAGGDPVDPLPPGRRSGAGDAQREPSERPEPDAVSDAEDEVAQEQPVASAADVDTPDDLEVLRR